MQNLRVIALDPGFGSEKLRTAEASVVLQSAVARPRDIGRAAAGIDVDAKPPEIRFDDQAFVVGPGAWNWGEPINSYDFTDIASPRRLALFYAVLAKALPPGEYQVDRLMIGLPTPLLRDELMAEMMTENIKRAYMREHTFSADGCEYVFKFRYGRAPAQPVGAYYGYILDDDGHVRRGSSKQEIAVLDIGMNTLDLYAVRAGKALPRFVGGSTHGVRRLIESIDGQADVEEIDHQLRERQIEIPDAAMESWLASVLGQTEKRWPRLSRFDVLIPVGGGAALLGEHLRRALAAKRATVEWPTDPITAVVDGLYKLGIKIL